MKPILVHIHVYYRHLWGELRSLLGKLEGIPFELHVSMVDVHEDIEREIAELWPSSRVYHVPNVGYDIAPFLQILQDRNLDDYSYIIKLHTKRDVNQDVVNLCVAREGFNMNGSKWREALLSFMQSDNLAKSLRALEVCSKIGMINNFLVICPKVQKADKLQYATWQRACEYIAQMGLSLPRESKFVMGAMFICRAGLFKPLQNLSLRSEDFPPPDPNHEEETVAHVIERVFGALITSQGYEISDPFTPLKVRFLVHAAAFVRKLGRFFYKSKLTKRGYRIVKVCCIPICHFKEKND